MLGVVDGPAVLGFEVAYDELLLGVIFVIFITIVRGIIVGMEVVF